MGYAVSFLTISTQQQGRYKLNQNLNNTILLYNTKVAKEIAIQMDFLL